MTVAPRWQTLLFASCVTLSVTAASVITIDAPRQLMLLATLTAVMGLPHGALDLPIAEALWPLASWREKALFALGYLGLAAAVIAVWVVVPTLALSAFLAYSALHFSGDWQGAPPRLRWSGGVATIAAPALFHRHDVAALFGYLAPASAGAFWADALAYAGVAALAVLIGAVAVGKRCRGRAALEQAALWVAAFALQPLVFFVVYFCALHSVRHFVLTIRSIGGWRHAMVTSVILSALVVAVAIAMTAYLRYGLHVAVDAAVVRVVFVGLAALTIPHMILVDRFHHRPIPGGGIPPGIRSGL